MPRSLPGEFDYSSKGETMSLKLILFVCEHGAAKSVIAVAYFNKMAQGMGVDQRALARGTNPDPERPGAHVDIAGGIIERPFQAGEIQHGARRHFHVSIES